MPLNRKAAIDYARRFWDRPCDDGVVWLTNAPIHVDHARKDLGTPASEGWEARFIPDGMGAEKAVFQRPFRGFIQHKLIHQWDGLADCAHFLSKCIQAGGTHVSEISVPKMVRSLMDR
jgi:hypothetical protein